jgi:hypothetical protein
MSLGGNASLLAWFERYHIIKTGPISFKYKTKAAKQYRDKLMAAAFGNSYLLPDLTPTEGVTPMDTTPTTAPGDPELLEEESKGIIETVSGFIEQKLSTVMETANASAAYMEEYAVTSPTVKAFDNKAMAFMDGFVDKVERGAKYTAETGSGFFSTVLSYTPLSCFGVSAEVLEDVREPNVGATEMIPMGENSEELKTPE